MLRLPAAGDPGWLRDAHAPGGAAPLCETVARISQLGRLRFEARGPPSAKEAGEYPTRAVWLPANCALRRFDLDRAADWAAVPGGLNVRLMGDSNMVSQIMDPLSDGSWFSRSHVSGGSPGRADYPVVVRPGGAAVRARFFRGMMCGDGITPYVTPDACPPVAAVRQGPGQRCLGAFGLKDRDFTSNYTGYNSVFVSGGWWYVLYHEEHEWHKFADGLRRTLTDCAVHHPALRRRVRLFYVQPVATNMTAGENRGQWRSLWNDRLLRFDSLVQGRVRHLVDAVVPLHAMTASWPWPASPHGDPHTFVKMRMVFNALMNYAVWGERSQFRPPPHLHRHSIPPAAAP